VLDAKGGENKGQSDKFIVSLVKSWLLVKTILLSLLSKVGFLWGEMLIMGKRGSFWES
jgi:hypothetical protein